METAARRGAPGRPRSFDRDAALQQAMLAFWHHGYEATSISDLTRVMGITAPSLYAAFGDKRTLFLEAARRYAGSPEALQQALDGAPTARAAVEAMVMRAVEGFTRPGFPAGCLLASATASVSAEAADVKAAITDMRRETRERIAARIVRDVATGALPQDTRAQTLADLTVALIQGLSVLARDGVSRQDLLAVVTVSMQRWPDACVP